MRIPSRELDAPWLKERHYQVVLADPPWAYEVDARQDQGRTSAAHYQTMSVEEIIGMAGLVREITKPTCALFLWVTNPVLPDAFRVMGAWGFPYKTVAFSWTKTTRQPLNPVGMEKVIQHGAPFVTESSYYGPGGAVLSSSRALAIGLGHYTRGAGEICLLGLRGRLKRHDRGVNGQIIAPLREHSRKPPEVQGGIERLFGNVPRVELFARGEARAGWDVWGLEAALP